MHWHMIKVYGGKDFAVKEDILALFPHAHIEIVEQSIPTKTERVRRLNVYSGYVFIKSDTMTEEELQAMRKSVSNITQIYTNAISQEDMDGMRATVLNDDQVITTGTQVQITQGPMVDMVGVIKNKIDDYTYLLTIRILNKDIEVKVAKSALRIII